MSKEWHLSFGVFLGLVVSGICALTVDKASSVTTGSLLVAIPGLIAMSAYAIGTRARK